jgi:large subunit ribosomal protein L4
MVKVVEDFTLENGKTKEAFEIMKALTSCVRVVLVYKEDNAVFKRAFRNIPWIKTLSYKRLAAHDLFYAREIVILKSAAEELESFYK